MSHYLAARVGRLRPAAFCLAAALEQPCDGLRSTPQTPPQTPAQQQQTPDEPPRVHLLLDRHRARAPALVGYRVAVTVLDRAAIAASGARTVADLPRASSPGLAVTGNGTRGGFSTAEIRGGDPNFTLVLLDGVPLNDSTYQGGGRLRPRGAAGLRRRAHRGGARPPLLVLRLDRPLRGDQHPHPFRGATDRRPSSSRRWRGTPRSARRRAPSPAPSARPPTSWAAPGSRSSTGWRRSASASRTCTPTSPFPSTAPACS